MTVAGELYKNIHEKLFQLRRDQLLITGLPKQDWLFDPVDEAVWKGFRAPDAEKYVFWLPTIRKTGKGSITDNDTVHNETSMPVIRTFDEMDRFNSRLKELNTVVVLKIHPEQEDNIAFKNKYSNIFILDNYELSKRHIHINQLLHYADALISDYSSVAMDYTMLDRPMAFSLDDKEEYEKSIGFVFDPIEDYIPGVPVYTEEELESFIDDVASGVDLYRDKRRCISMEMNEFQDNRNCERVLKAVGIG